MSSGGARATSYLRFREAMSCLEPARSDMPTSVCLVRLRESAECRCSRRSTHTWKSLVARYENCMTERKQEALEPHLEVFGS